MHFSISSEAKLELTDSPSLNPLSHALYDVWYTIIPSVFRIMQPSV